MKIAVLFLIVSAMHAFAQTWHTGDRSRKQEFKIETDFLVIRTPIKLLDPPRLTSMKISWDKIIGKWTIDLQSEAVLDPIYKPCSFTFGDFSSYTFRAGDRDGASFLTLSTESYEQAIIVRDALIKLHKLSPEQVVTDDKDAGKRRD